VRWPESRIVSAVGAGDAFFAGMLFSLHEGRGLGDALSFANAAAATCLRHPTCTGGVADEREIRALAETCPKRDSG